MRRTMTGSRQTAARSINRNVVSLRSCGGILAAILVIAILSSCRRAAQPRKPDAQISDQPSSAELLARVGESYNRLDSYQDEGVSVTTYNNGRTTELHFTTAFTRQGRFRFEFWEPAISGGEDRMVVWKDGNTVKSWWTVNPVVESRQDLGLAIAGATGVSGGTAYLIPPVLMKEAAWKNRTWTDSNDAYRIKDGEEGGASYYRVQRLTSTGGEKVGGYDIPKTEGKVTYWICKDSFLLARVDQETDFGRFFANQTIRYATKVNVQIEDTAFQFGH